MNKINNYEDLRAERRRLEAQLKVQQVYIKSHLHTIKDRLEPLGKVMSFVTGMGGKNRSKTLSLLKLGSSVGIDLLVGKKLKTAGWLARLLVPLAMKITAQKTIDRVQK